MPDGIHHPAGNRFGLIVTFNANNAANSTHRK